MARTARPQLGDDKMPFRAHTPPTQRVTKGLNDTFKAKTKATKESAMKTKRVSNKRWAILVGLLSLWAALLYATDPPGTITTVAGGGSTLGDGGPATNAALWFPFDVTTDTAGNLYIADLNNSRVRKVEASTGVITTVAGNGIAAFSGDGGSATAASLQYPVGVAVNSAGDIYIADTNNHRIRKVSAGTGVITTVAGTGYRTGIIDGPGGNPQDDLGDGGPAIGATLAQPYRVAIDVVGNLYISDTYNSRIRKVDASTGIISTVAGGGLTPCGGDGGPATSANIAGPIGIAFDGAGNLYIASWSCHRVRKVDAVSGTITTVAGTGANGLSSDGGQATSATLFGPAGVALDAAGNLFIGDQYNNRIRRVDTATGIITTVAGGGSTLGDGGPATSANLSNPVAVCLDAAGSLYIADATNHRIRRVVGVASPLPTAKPVLAWGGNSNGGQLGDGTLIDRFTPVASSGLEAIAISSSNVHSLALLEDGSVVAWGNNSLGQLGDGTTTNRQIPTSVVGILNVTAVAAGGGHSLALKTDGTVWAWGQNAAGELGDGSQNNRSLPGQVSGLGGVVAIAAAGRHSLALKSDGTMWAWGWNIVGQLGQITNPNFSTVPIQVPGLTGVVRIAAGQWQSLAVRNDGTTWAWGGNSAGQVGDGTITDRYSPVLVSGLSNVKAIAGGFLHSLAVKQDGSVWAWGANNYGQLGVGSQVNSPVPMGVMGLSGVSNIGAGSGFSLALKSDGTVWAWGANDHGQIGVGGRSGMSYLLPVQIQSVEQVSAIAAGSVHSLVLGGLAFPADTTPPVITHTVTGTLGNDGWYVSDMTVEWTAEDNESAVTSTSGCDPQTVNSDTTGITFTCTATSTGGTASQSITLKRDATPPQINLSAPSDGGTYVLNAAAASNYSCEDYTSGLASCSAPVASGANFNTAPVGPKSFTVSAMDNAGNTASLTHNYAVSYNVCALYDQFKVWKSGATVPVKLQLCDADGANQFAPGILVTANQLSLVGGALDLPPEDSGNANPDSNFRYDAALQGYIFNLSTKGLGSGTWELSFSAAGDPAPVGTHGVRFGIK